MAMTDPYSSPAPATSAIAFVDLEASGLNAQSWPIEAGWVHADGAEPVSILIKPAEDWKETGWDRQAAGLHGISREQLQREGVDLVTACRRLNAVFAGCTVYSDAPDWDSFWLYRLFTSARMRQSFQLSNFADFVRPLMVGREDAILDEAEKLAPRRHRAGADARHLQTIYQLALDA